MFAPQLLDEPNVLLRPNAQTATPREQPQSNQAIFDILCIFGRDYLLARAN